MARIEGSTTTGSPLAEVDTYLDSLRISKVPRGAGYAASGVSGTIAATTNGHLWTIRLDPSAATNYRLYLEKLRVNWTTITAFATPVTARRLELVRGSGATPSGQTAVTTTNKYSGDTGSETLTSGGGDVRISNTGAITITSITFETTAPLAVMPFTHAGGAGGNQEWIFDYTDNPVVLSAGQVLGIRTGAALDATGTGSLAVTAEWFEGVLV